jgi:hypothetical protein
MGLSASRTSQANNKNFDHIGNQVPAKARF